MTPFRRERQVIRRPAGEYGPDGFWRPATEPLPDAMMLGIQPASAGDYAEMKPAPEGRRITDMLRAYADLDAPPLAVAGDDGAGGDIVIYEGRRYLVIGAARRDTLGPPVAHVRYLLVREAEWSEGEVMA